MSRGRGRNDSLLMSAHLPVAYRIFLSNHATPAIAISHKQPRTIIGIEANTFQSTNKFRTQPHKQCNPKTSTIPTKSHPFVIVRFQTLKPQPNLILIALKKPISFYALGQVCKRTKTSLNTKRKKFPAENELMQRNEFDRLLQDNSKRLKSANAVETARFFKFFAFPTTRR